MCRSLLFGLICFTGVLAFAPPSAQLQTPIRRVAPSSVSMKFRTCDLTGKRRNAKAMTVTFSHTRNHKVQKVNLQNRKLWWEEGNRYVKMRVSTKALKVRFCLYLFF